MDLLDLNENIPMIFVLALIALAVVEFMRERLAVEMICVIIFAVLILFGYFSPVYNAAGINMLGPEKILAGLSNPSLIAVMALLVMGQALVQTDTLRVVTGIFTMADAKYSWLALLSILVFVMLASAFVNNTPLVVIAIPLVQALANASGLSEGRLMMPLSYVAILGGMTTVVGSSTNLLVSHEMVNLGYESLGFFSFFVPGSILMGVGFLYVIFVLPSLLKERGSFKQGLIGNNKEFIAELAIDAASKLVGVKSEGGRFTPLGDMSVRMIQRGGQLFLPPFNDYTIESGDIIIGAANRKSLTKILANYPGSFLSDGEEGNDNPDATPENMRMLAEVMITPASRTIDQSLEMAALDEKNGLTVLGIQRRARIVRRRLGRVRLEAGDVLLVAGRRSSIAALRNNTDFIVLSGSKRDIPTPAKAPIAAVIFLAVISCASLEILSVPVAAIVGAAAMTATGCLNIRQALRALDRKIYLLVASMLALGVAMQETGGVEFIADLLLQLPVHNSPFLLLAIFFLCVATLTNLLSNNSCAILFTPIAMNMANAIHFAPESSFSLSYIFAVTVIFAANCSFASPIGYQTNLLIMGPGHYRFRDFIKAGVPLIFVIWIAYLGLLKFYFGL